MVSVLLASALPVLVLDWTTSGDWAYGGSVGAGDVNGDGFDDVIVGAPRNTFEFDPQLVHVYLGTVAGLDTTPVWTAESRGAGTRFGFTVSSADVNGDGFDDVIVGGLFTFFAEGSEGVTFVYHGSAAGPSSVADWSASSNQAGAGFGAASSAGDVNGDGFADVIVGSGLYDAAVTDGGAAFLFLGSSTGLTPEPAWSVFGDIEGGGMGAAVACAGDVNADGFDDVLVGGDDVSGAAVRLYLGSATGLSPTAAWAQPSPQLFSGFAAQVAGVGDVDGDGFDDVAVSSPEWDASDVIWPDSGAVFLYRGSPSGLHVEPAWSYEGTDGSTHCGTSVEGAGDVDGDGFDDLVLGCPGYLYLAGEVDLFLGSPTGLGAEPSWSVVSTEESADFGKALSSAGDVNGDAFDDVLVGAPDAYGVGTALVYRGVCDLPGADSDLDGRPDLCDACVGDPTNTDRDRDGACSDVDCDDLDAAIHPGAVEACNGIDDSCGGLGADEQDGDGDGWRTCAGDCDDDDAGRWPGARESCDGRDNDCDGMLPPDERDGDGDGVSACGGDCDDGTVGVGPDVVEVCGDGIDNNCDGAVDDVCAAPSGDDGGGCGCETTGRLPGALAVLLAGLAATSRRRVGSTPVRSTTRVAALAMTLSCGSAGTFCQQVVSDDEYMVDVCPDLARQSRVDHGDCVQTMNDGCSNDEIAQLEQQLDCDADPCTNNTQAEQDCLAAIQLSVDTPCVDALHAL